MGNWGRPQGRQWASSHDEPTTRGRGGVLARARARRYGAIVGVAERLVALARTPPHPRAHLTESGACSPAKGRYCWPMRTLLLLALAAAPAVADVQRIAPGTGLQNAVVVDTGANGICETTAAKGDEQSANVGQGSANRAALRCGPNRDVDTTAQGDDVQLVAVGGTCRNANVTI